MHLSKALLDAVSLYHDDVEWVQLIDYEHVSFRCRRCHAIGHLFCDYPLNKKPLTPSAFDKPDSDGFTKVTNRRKNHMKPIISPKLPHASSSKPSTSNSFEILACQDGYSSENPTLSKEEPKMNKQFSHFNSKKFG